MTFAPFSLTASCSFRSNRGRHVSKANEKGQISTLKDFDLNHYQCGRTGGVRSPPILSSATSVELIPNLNGPDYKPPLFFVFFCGSFTLLTKQLPDKSLRIRNMFERNTK